MWAVGIGARDGVTAGDGDGKEERGRGITVIGYNLLGKEEGSAAQSYDRPLHRHLKLRERWSCYGGGLAGVVGGGGREESLGVEEGDGVDVGGGAREGVAARDGDSKEERGRGIAITSTIAIGGRRVEEEVDEVTEEGVREEVELWKRVPSMRMEGLRKKSGRR